MAVGPSFTRNKRKETLLCVRTLIVYIVFCVRPRSACIAQDPDIPEWCMVGCDVLPGGGADVQPKGSGRPGLGEAPATEKGDQPRDASHQCVICQEEKRGQWRALPCAHVFHDKCVKDWLEQNPSCPVCRMTFPTLQAGGSGRAEAWLGSTALTTSDGALSAMHQVLSPDLFSWLPDSLWRSCSGRGRRDGARGH